jgi:hypothetical protein
VHVTLLGMRRDTTTTGHARKCLRASSRAASQSTAAFSGASSIAMEPLDDTHRRTSPLSCVERGGWSEHTIVLDDGLAYSLEGPPSLADAAGV